MGDSTSDRLTVGILGGMSSESTVEYYRGIDEGINEALAGDGDASATHEAGDLLIRSVNFAEVERFIREDSWTDAGEFLAGAAADLDAGGADFVVMATNTMHRVAPAIEAAISIPLVHIVDVTAEAIHMEGIDTVGVLGTATTMEAPFYRERFERHGIDVVVPGPDDREAVDDVIFAELTHGVVRERSRQRYLDVVDDLVAAGAGGIVLGCTEIELLIEQDDRPSIPMFDTTALHVERAVACSLRERDPGDERPG